MSSRQLVMTDGPVAGAPDPRKVERGTGSWADHLAEADEWERRHEAEWVRVDQRLRGLAGRRAALDAEEAHLLRYAEELKLWRGYGFGSLLEYMERAMGYAPHTAAERLRVARALAELPLIADALERGELAHSAVRELSRVAVPDTEELWLEATLGKSLREVEAMVAGHRPGDLPTDPTEPRIRPRKITLEVSPETYDIWRRLHALAAEEHGQRLSDDELIPALFRRAYSDGAADGAGGSAGAAGSPAYKIALKQCPDCKRAWQYSGGRDLEIDPALVECAACDAVHLGSLDAAAPERATMSVTPRRREQVLSRDGYCCTVPGCRRNVGLDLHHIEYQSQGGGHELSNLTTTCDLHHRAVHFGKLVIQGSAPDRLSFEFRRPRDRRNITDDDADAPPRSSAAATAAPLTAAAAAPAEAPHVPIIPAAPAKAPLAPCIAAAPAEAPPVPITPAAPAKAPPAPCIATAPAEAPHVPIIPVAPIALLAASSVAAPAGAIATASSIAAAPAMPQHAASLATTQAIPQHAASLATAQAMPQHAASLATAQAEALAPASTAAPPVDAPPEPSTAAAPAEAATAASTAAALAETLAASSIAATTAEPSAVSDTVVPSREDRT